MTTLADIRKSLVSNFAKVEAFYLVLGRAAVQLHDKHGLTWAEVTSRVNEWLPSASAVGLNLSMAFIRRAYGTASTLDAKGALISPAGVVVEPEALASALNPAELDRAAAAIAAASSTKQGPKVRVNDAKALADVFANPKASNDDKAKAKLAFMRKVEEVEHYQAASAAGDELALLKQAFQAKLKQIDKAQERLNKLNLEASELYAQIVELEPEPEAKPETSTKPRRRRTKAQVASAATA